MTSASPAVLSREPGQRTRGGLADGDPRRIEFREFLAAEMAGDRAKVREIFAAWSAYARRTRAVTWEMETPHAQGIAVIGRGYASTSAGLAAATAVSGKSVVAQKDNGSHARNMENRRDEGHQQNG